jgi:septal ring factor EnvC (AmiA/AmiB activator)
MTQTALFVIAVLALLASDVLLFVLGYSAYRLRSADAGRREPLHGARDEIAALQKSLTGMAEHMAGLEQRLQQFEECQEKLEARGENGAQPFEVAARLVSQGASLDQIVSVCGISRGEAELMLSLYSSSKRA